MCEAADLGEDIVVIVIVPGESKVPLYFIGLAPRKRGLGIPILVLYNN